RGADPSQTYKVFFVQPDLHLGAVVDLKYGATPTEVRLQPTATVRGKIVTPDGQPAKDAQGYALLATANPENKLDRMDYFSGDRIIIYANMVQKLIPKVQ